ncbi:MAG: DUF2177 family protein [Patescibacteria group bacterium]|nr:DUF2177 family protein [Patescibacteria group bacterium]
MAAGVPFWILDAIWLGIVSKNFYQKELGSLLRKDINWSPAIIFYLLYPLGITIFALVPVKDTNSLQKAASLGALLGLIAYATYDLSNFATLKDWPISVVITDIFWGIFVTATSTAIAYLLLNKF